MLIDSDVESDEDIKSWNTGESESKWSQIDIGQILLQ